MGPSGERGQGNGILLPQSRSMQDREGPIQCHERRGGILKYTDSRRTAPGSVATK